MAYQHDGERAANDEWAIRPAAYDIAATISSCLSANRDEYAEHARAYGRDLTIPDADITEAKHWAMLHCEPGAAGIWTLWKMIVQLYIDDAVARDSAHPPVAELTLDELRARERAHYRKGV